MFPDMRYFLRFIGTNITDVDMCLIESNLNKDSLYLSDNLIAHRRRRRHFIHERRQTGVDLVHPERPICLPLKRINTMSGIRIHVMKVKETEEVDEQGLS